MPIISVLLKRIRMEKLIRIFFCFILIAMVSCLLFSCKKAADQSSHEYFIKTFTSDSGASQQGFYFEQLADGGFMIVSDQNGYPLLTRTDKFGNIIKQKYVPNPIFYGVNSGIFIVF